MRPSDEVDFLMEDSFSYEEDIDDERDIKRKKLALKEQVASAKSHLDGLKSKYYEEIKAGSKLTSEQQKAVDFFNRYNKESDETSKVVEKQKLTFNKKPWSTAYFLEIERYFAFLPSYGDLVFSKLWLDSKKMKGGYKKK